MSTCNVPLQIVLEPYCVPWGASLCPLGISGPSEGACLPELLGHKAPSICAVTTFVPKTAAQTHHQRQQVLGKPGDLFTTMAGQGAT